MSLDWLTLTPDAGHAGEVQPDRVALALRLAAAGCIAAEEEAEVLLRTCRGDPVVLPGLVARRIEGEPIAWLTGSVTFCDVDLFVDLGVYVPRWQTEPLARRAAELLPSQGVGVDLCTGTGAVAAVLANSAPQARVVATELDRVAARCARRNGVEVFDGSLDDPLPAELRNRSTC